MKLYAAPKAIAEHPGVEACEHGPSEGFAEYKHHVWLREGWAYKNGRMAGCRTGNFQTVKDFERAAPAKTQEDTTP